MAYVINPEKCISCGTCAANCPAEAITYVGTHYAINPEHCVMCGTCAINCPAEAVEEK